MATIKDIAKLAKTSQGTVSNVLNNKGNVSSEKIQRVLKAAKELNYIPNLSAKNLRKGHSDDYHIIIPNLDSEMYINVYKSFLNHAKKENINVILHITHNDPEKEFEILELLKPEIIISMKVVVITTLSYGSRYPDFNKSFLEKIIFALNDYIDSTNYITFDYYKAGEEIFSAIKKEGYNNICILQNSIINSSEEEAKKAIIEKSKTDFDGIIDIIHLDPFKSHLSILSEVSERKYDIFILLDYGFSTVLRDIITNFSYAKNNKIISISPLTFFQDNSLLRYELDYNQLGKIAFQYLKRKVSPGKIILNNSGFKSWIPKTPKLKKPIHLKLLSVENPSAHILRYLAKEYELLTNVKIDIKVFNYDEVYKILSNQDKVLEYDIVRMDINWFTWFAESIYTPIDLEKDLYPNIAQKLPNKIVDNHLSTTDENFGVPFSPSALVLFVRKDLFEREDIKRLYYEQEKEKLSIPTCFNTFDKIARFFTKEYNSLSPVEYGTTLTMGNAAVRGTELLMRYYSYEDSIINEKGKFDFKQSSLNKALINLKQTLKFSNPSNWWSDTAKTFSNGNVAMSIMYGNYAPEFLQSNSKVIDKIDSFVVPGGNPMIGGGGLGVVKTSKNQKLAIDFLSWLSMDSVVAQSSLLGNLPSNDSVFNYTEITDIYPWFETTKQSISLSKCPKTYLSSSHTINEVKLFDILGNIKIYEDLKNNLDTNTIAKKIINNINLNSDILFKKSD